MLPPCLMKNLVLDFLKKILRYVLVVPNVTAIIKASSYFRF